MIQIIEKVSEDLRIYKCMYVLSCGGRNGGALLFLFHLIMWEENFKLE